MPSPIYQGAFYNETLSNRIPASLAVEVRTAQEEISRHPGLEPAVYSDIASNALLVVPRLPRGIVIDALKIPYDKVLPHMPTYT
jgi:hypothetical protein